MKSINLELSLNDQINLLKQKEAFDLLSREEVLDLLLMTVADIMRLDNEIRYLMKGQIRNEIPSNNI
jgi:single-stranded DNA-specific DHH superfamily exonuclease